MNKSQLESKHIAELHELAAAAGVERYRMLTRAELIEKLANGKPKAEPQRRPKRERKPRERKQEPKGEPEARAAAEPRAAERGPHAERPKRKRRRRRWGRRRKRGGIREHADRWLEAWNGRDLDEIAACYSEDVEFVLPALVGDSEERRIGGREALREHFRHGLELAPNLTVSEESLLVGPRGFAILYRREDGHRAIETVELDDAGLASRVRVFYEREQPDG
ncbi:MAG TPA: nuclear transport factor 2 family protein [Solirubrobacterales bacterium]|nr:nuclear transport factor 2 family protein [Solirubrobacterales bacterium]